MYLDEVTKAQDQHVSSPCLSPGSANIATAATPLMMSYP